MERDEICTTYTPLDRQTPNNTIKANDSVSISLVFPTLGGRERFNPYPVTEPDELIVLGDDAARSCSVQYQARDLNASDLQQHPSLGTSSKARIIFKCRRNGSQTPAFYARFSE
jgi:hypothetical protein